MQKYVAFEKTDMGADLALQGLSVLEKPKGWAFRIEVQFDDKIFKSLQKDHILLREMNSAAKKHYKLTCKLVQEKYSQFDKLLRTQIDNGLPPREVETTIARLNELLRQEKTKNTAAGEQAVRNLWNTWAAKKKEYKEYKIKIAATAVGATAGLGTSIGLMAATPFTGGASAAFGIIGMVKSAVVLFKEIASAWIEIETSQAILHKYLAALKTITQENKVALKANEYAEAVVLKFVGLALPNIKEAEIQYKIVVQKLTGIEVLMHSGAKKVNNILDEQSKLRQEFMKEVQKKLEKHPSRKALDQPRLIEARLDAYMQPAYDAVNNALKNVTRLHHRVKKAKKDTEDLNNQLAPLRGLRGVDNKILENILYVADLPLAGLHGNAISKETMDIVNGLVPVGTLMVYDRICSKVLDHTLLA